MLTDVNVSNLTDVPAGMSGGGAFAVSSQISSTFCVKNFAKSSAVLSVEIELLFVVFIKPDNSDCQSF